MFKRLINTLLMLAYIIIVVVLILYFGFWRGYEEKLLERVSPEKLESRLSPPRHIDQATMRLLGSAHPMKLSHYIHKEVAKPPGTIRICALGDSHTQGDEVGKQHDYSSYLQRQFQDRGIENVEVVNFGNGWYGFSQIYVMWEQVARKFSCDFVTLLPMYFWWQRDITFNHSDGRAPDFLHARLVLENGHLRLVAPIGDTAQERLHNYVRPIPYYHYLRYDRHPISIIDAMLPVGKHVPNPFYYDPRPPAEEMDEIYQRIIQEIAGEGPQVLVLFKGSNRILYPQLIPSRPEGIGAASVEEKSHFPYLAPANHPSSWGNEIVAHAFFRMLTGQEPYSLKQAYTRDMKADATETPPPLYDYQSIWLSYEHGEPGAVFVAAENQQGARKLHMNYLQKHDVAALLALKEPGASIADSCLIPLYFIPENNAELVLSKNTGNNKDINLGKLQQLQPGVAIFSVQLDVVHGNFCGDSTAKHAGHNRKGKLTIGGAEVAILSDNIIKVNNGPLAIRELGEYQASAQNMDEQQVLSIHLQPEQGAAIQRPLLQLLAGTLPANFKLNCAPARVIELATRNATVKSQKSGHGSTKCIKNAAPGPVD